MNTQQRDPEPDMKYIFSLVDDRLDRLTVADLLLTRGDPCFTDDPAEADPLPASDAPTIPRMPTALEVWAEMVPADWDDIQYGFYLDTFIGIAAAKLLDRSDPRWCEGMMVWSKDHYNECESDWSWRPPRTTEAQRRITFSVMPRLGLA